MNLSKRMRTFKEFDIKKHCRVLTEAQVTPPNVTAGLNKLREELPQLQDIENFVNYCRQCGTRVFKRNITAYKLKPAQSHVDFDKVIDIIQSGALTDISPIAIDKDGYIIDGHHRWSAVMYTNPIIDVPVYQFNIKLKNLMSRKIKWYSFDNKLDDLVGTVFGSKEEL